MTNPLTTGMEVSVGEVARATEVDILVIGFGFSVIPLLRELDLSGRKYTILCERNSVWDRLHEAGRLDFDLVSSYYTSFYSFELVDDPRGDGFPTAREFYDLRQRYYEDYKQRIIDDFVEVVWNYESHSIVRTRSGRFYRAKQLVISTSFRRRITEELTGLDYDMTGKTIVLNTVGDSANLMISKLVPGNNEIICLHEGFVPIDKIMSLNGVTYTIDQLEFHNFGFHFRRTYRNLIAGGICPMNIIESALAKTLQMTFLAPLFCRHNFQSRFKIVRHHELDQFPTTPLPNGVITTKYWPVDKYAEEFSANLSEAIASGYLLNDIAFFANEGFVKFWPRRETEIDLDEGSVTRNGQRVRYDYFVEADTEAPNVPHIVIMRDVEKTDFEYRYRESYYGVVPSRLQNVYFLGLTRPTTGGLANITEMQCLLVHKMLMDDGFRKEIGSSLAGRIDDYNRSHYLKKEAGKTDHVVWYGSYTEELARLLGINIRLRDSRSLKALNQYLFLPNNAFKYRQTGEYRVEGCNNLVEHVYHEHRKYSVIHQYVMTFMLYRLLFFEYAVLLYVEGTIPFVVLAALVFVQLVFAKVFVIPTQNYFGLLKVAYLSLGAIAMAVIGSGIFFPLLLADFSYTYFVRQRGFRHMFNDLKDKPRYRGFFKRYREAYLATRSCDGAV